MPRGAPHNTPPLSFVHKSSVRRHLGAEASHLEDRIGRTFCRIFVMNGQEKGVSGEEQMAL